MLDARVIALIGAGMMPLACSIVQSVDGYAGPPLVSAEAGEDGSSVQDAVVEDAVFETHPCANASECDDNNVCNGEETCVEGMCQPGTSLVVDDQNTCTVDYCEPDAGVRHDKIENPSYVQCAPFACPKDTYRVESSCDKSCGGCGSCINAFICQKPCTEQVTACCVSAAGCASACPPGYTPISQMESDGCGCRVDAGVTPGPAVVCRR
ncbi:MAG: hypothetical protein HY898_21075 [Deltaproteobacteria bacterium]|nr:hypothetical protein [Deltaproteobacteria bacterium]